MSKEPFIFFGIVILLLTVVLLIQYFYFKRQQKLFFTSIQDKNYNIIRDVETDIEIYSKLKYKFVHRMADIVFLKDEIFIIIHKQCIKSGKILQISKSSDFHSGVSRKLICHSKLKVSEQLEIKGQFVDFILTQNFKITLHLKNKGFDIASVLN
ncbi:hypothetical protein [Chryseobacterium paridis]|uniref:Uncharacterized protein n=1 Tax=Chryseobacterium paridis TaxID=2800328 RepID=A0ABS1FWK4_9FLAO|nr:hypothetical protein [Chryseobacterium paridis]MBK1896780.1 hypothetical protein [Chryseobacterium paridis]